MKNILHIYLLLAHKGEFAEEGKDFTTVPVVVKAQRKMRLFHGSV